MVDPSSLPDLDSFSSILTITTSPWETRTPCTSGTIQPVGLTWNTSARSRWRPHPLALLPSPGHLSWFHKKRITSSWLLVIKPLYSIWYLLAEACPSGWEAFSDSCYLFGNGANWTQAEANCVKDGAHLASIHSKAENDFIVKRATTGKTQSTFFMTWVGGRRSEKDIKKWEWTDGTPVSSHGKGSRYPQTGPLFPSFSSSTTPNGGPISPALSKRSAFK